MTLRRIDRSDWTDFCQRVSAALPGKWAEIEVASPHFGAQIQAHWLPVVGVAYDERDDAFEVMLDGLDHLIFHPRAVYADFGLAGIESLAIVEGDAWQIVLLRDPVMLPPPGAPHA